MKITKRTVAHLERGYSITVIPGDQPGELPAFLAGSEGEGELLLLEPPFFEPRVIARQPGGYISVAPVSIAGRRYAIASTLFKPGFNAASSALRLYPLDQGEMPPSQFIADLPYTHRVAVLQHGARNLLFASTLCAGKTHTDDWSQPGGIHLFEVPGDASGKWVPGRKIVAGLNKNHGFDFAVLHRQGGYLLSAMEGLLFMPIQRDIFAEWPTELIAAGEYSDAYAYDWNRDGQPEIFSISPFHGNVLCMHEQKGGAWTRTVIHDDLSLGHIVWAGDFLGRPGLLAGSRRTRRELRLYRPTGTGEVDRNYELIDEEIGPSQIAVIQRPRGNIALYVAAHGQNEIRIYEIEN